MSALLCTGLSFEETATFAGLLLTAPKPSRPNIAGRSGDLLHIALRNAFKSLDQTARTTQAHTTLQRLRQAEHLPTTSLHPDWFRHLQSTERPEVPLCLHNQPPNHIPNETVSWVRQHLAVRFGLRDPRITPDTPTELASLSTFHERDIQALSMTLGLAVSSRILHTLGKRLLASLLQALGNPLNDLLIQLLHTPPTLDRTLIRIGRRHFSTLGQTPETSLPQLIQDVGSTLLVCALVFRSPTLVRAIAHTTPLSFGEPLLSKITPTLQSSLMRSASPHCETLLHTLTQHPNARHILHPRLSHSPIQLAPRAL